MSALASMVEAYLAGPGTLRQAVQGLSREQLLARPVAGKWSTLEVVCHLADFEPIMADRMKRIIAEERPQLLGASEVRFAAALAKQQGYEPDANVCGDDVPAGRPAPWMIFRVMEQLDVYPPAAAFQRVGIHNERGPLTLEGMLTNAINHIPHHVKFIEEKRKALGLPAEAAT